MFLQQNVLLMRFRVLLTAEVSVQHLFQQIVYFQILFVSKSRSACLANWKEGYAVRLEDIVLKDNKEMAFFVLVISVLFLNQKLLKAFRIYMNFQKVVVVIRFHCNYFFICYVNSQLFFLRQKILKKYFQRNLLL